MKLKGLLWGACACAMLAGCSNDDVAVDNGNNVLTNGGEAYVKVRIAMADGAYSRAATEGGYDYGTDEDHVIKSLYFGFYNADGSWAAAGKNNYEDLSTTGKKDSPVGNIDATLDEAVIALELNENDPFPTQMVAYVNISSEDFASKIQGKSLTDAKSQTFEGNVDDETNGFIMTNSTYLDASGKEKIAADVTDANFFEDPEVAKVAEPVVIYVERLAAKVTVKSEVQSVDDIDAGEYTLKFEPQGYVVSGTNTKEYFLKNIEESWNSWDWFNEADDYRCFWAKDPNYESMGTVGLSYASYEEADKHDLDVAQYCMENTLTAELAESDGYKAYTHLLMVGQYVVMKGEEKVDLSTASDGYLYRFGGTIYLADDIRARLLDQAADNQLAFSDQQGTQVGEANYSIVRIGKTNTITLKLNKPTEGTTYYTRTGSEGSYSYTEITDYDAYNKGLAEYLEKNIGKPEAFNDGKAYFVVPIEHFGTEGETGAIGVVRNHSYVLTIKKVTGMGEGIFDPTEPIEPNPQTKKYYVAATLNILSWKTVSQNVNFGE